VGLVRVIEMEKTYSNFTRKPNEVVMIKLGLSFNVSVVTGQKDFLELVLTSLV